MCGCASVKGSYDCTRSGRLEDVPEKTIVFLALTQITAFRPKQKVILWRSSVAQHEAGIIFLSKVKTVRCLSKIHLMQKDAKPSNPILENYLGTPIPPKYNVVFVDLDVDERDC